MARRKKVLKGKYEKDYAKLRTERNRKMLIVLVSVFFVLSIITILLVALNDKPYANGDSNNDELETEMEIPDEFVREAISDFNLIKSDSDVLFETLSSKELDKIGEGYADEE